MKIFFVFLFVALSSPVVSGTVDTAQRYLNILGYDAGVVDGLYGSKTKRALTAFFADRGTKYDGTLDDAEIAALLDTGFLGEAAIKSGAHSPKEILPTRPAVFDSKPCIDHVHTRSTYEVETILSRNDFSKIDAFAPNEEGFLKINEIAESFLSKIWSEPTEENSQQIKSLFKLLFEAEYAAKPKNNDNDDSLPTKNFLLTAMYIYSVLEKEGQLSSREKLEYLAELQKRFEAIQYAPRRGFLMNRCSIGRDTFDCQNHTYSHQHVRTMYGALFNDETHFNMGAKIYKFAIDDLNGDGALWREAVRGKWAWRYYGHGLSHLLSIAEIYRLNGYDLYSYKSPKNGMTIHDAVEFYLKALQAPEMMWKYANRLAGVADRDGAEDYKSREYLSLVSSQQEGDGIKNWYYVYRSVFPDHKNTLLAETLIPTYGVQMANSNNVGYFAQCIYKSVDQEIGPFFFLR